MEGFLMKFVKKLVLISTISMTVFASKTDIKAAGEAIPLPTIKDIVDTFIDKSAGPKGNTADDYNCFSVSDFGDFTLPSYNKENESLFCYCICDANQSNSNSIPSKPSKFCASLTGQCKHGSASLQCKIISKDDNDYLFLKDATKDRCNSNDILVGYADWFTSGSITIKSDANSTKKSVNRS